MSYLIDRERAFRVEEVVLLLAVRRRGTRSRLVLSDGSLAATLTRPRTIQNSLRQGLSELKGVVWRRSSLHRSA